MKIDLNADVAEGCDDAGLYGLVSSVNIACGGHAGDDASIREAIARAVEAGASVGAHPGYADRDGFGRTEMTLDDDELEFLIVSQVDRVGRMASVAGCGLAHVKPHGALYNMAAIDARISAILAATVAHIHPALRLVGLAGSVLTEAGRALGMPVTDEGFADRGYLSAGTLAPRGTPGALIEDPSIAAAQALAIAQGKPFDTVDGGSVTVRAQTICLHSDTPGAIENARAVRAALERASIGISPVC